MFIAAHAVSGFFTPELPCLYTQADNKMKLKLNKSGRVVYPRCFPSM
jgi:hypothetical protein